MTKSKSILEALAQDARVMRGARMLPTDRVLTPDEITQVQRDLARYVNENRITLQSVAKDLGCHASTLTQFKNSKYQGDQDKLARAVNEYIGRQTERRQVQLPRGFVELEAAQRMLVVVRQAINHSAIGVIVGPAGVGKTMTLQAAASMFAGSILIRISQSTTRSTGLMNEFARAMGTPRRNGVAATFRTVIDALRGTNRLILIDEAHKLTELGLEAIRDVHDEAGVPIILCGTSRLRQSVSDHTMFYGQMSSRIIARVDMVEFMTEGGGGRRRKPLFTVEDIRKVFESDRVRLTDDACRWLSALSCHPGAGGLRLVHKVLAIASMVAKWRGHAINEAMCAEVLDQMHDTEFTRQVSDLMTSRTERLQARTA